MVLKGYQKLTANQQETDILLGKRIRQVPADGVYEITLMSCFVPSLGAGAALDADNISQESLFIDDDAVVELGACRIITDIARNRVNEDADLVYADAVPEGFPQESEHLTAQVYADAGSVIQLNAQANGTAGTYFYSLEVSPADDDDIDEELIY